jgi:hypothetical protein
MFFLPFEYFEIHTHLSPKDIYQKLCSVLEPWHMFPSDIYRFFGWVNTNYFKISRKTGAFELFPPVIAGKICLEGKGSSIKVTIRLSWFTFVYLICFFGVVGIGIVEWTSNWLVLVAKTGLLQIETLWVFLFYIGSFSLGYLMMCTQIKMEAHLSRKFLFYLFEVEPDKDVIFYRRFLGLSQVQQFILFLILTVVVLFLATLVKLK